MDQITEQVDAKMQDAANILIHLPWTFQAHRGKKKNISVLSNNEIYA